MVPRYQHLHAHLSMHRLIDTLPVPLKTFCACGSLPPPDHSSLLPCPLHSPSVPKAKAGGTLGPGSGPLLSTFSGPQGAFCYPSIP